MSRRRLPRGTVVVVAEDGRSRFSDDSRFRLIASLGSASFCVFAAVVAFFEGTLRIEPKARRSVLSKKLGTLTQEGVDDARSYFNSRLDLDPDRVSPYDQIRNMRCLDPRAVLRLQGPSKTLGEAKLKKLGSGNFPLLFKDARVPDFALTIIERMALDQAKRSTALLLWHPPDAVAVFCLKGPGEEETFALYDPRPRPEFAVDGAALYRFENRVDCARHLRTTFCPSTATTRPPKKVGCPQCGKQFSPLASTESQDDRDVTCAFNSVEGTFVTYVEEWKEREGFEAVPRPFREEEDGEVEAPAAEPEPAPEMSGSIFHDMNDFDFDLVAPAPVPPANPEVVRLRSENTKLKAKIATLEESLRKLSGQ